MSENASTNIEKNVSDRKKIKLKKDLFCYCTCCEQLKFVCVCKNDKSINRNIIARGIYYLITFIDKF